MLIDVSLYIIGDCINIDEVTRVMGVMPVRAGEKGERRNPSSRHLNRNGFWVYTSSGESNTLCDQIDELMNVLRSVSLPLNTLAGVECANVDIYIGFRENERFETVEIDISPECISLMSKLGLSFSIKVTD